jgi:hypothetical protein
VKFQNASRGVLENSFKSESESFIEADVKSSTVTPPNDLGGGRSRWCVIRVGMCSGVTGHRICGSCANGVDGCITEDRVDESGRGIVVDRTEAVDLVDLCHPVELCWFV